jgi:hypothetical protein
VCRVSLLSATLKDGEAVRQICFGNCRVGFPGSMVLAIKPL